jgi:hypothetical protein
MATAQQAMGAENYEKYRNFIKNKESGGNYASLQNVNLKDKAGNIVASNVDAGYRGAYQIGAEYAQSQGLIKPGIETDYRKLGNTRIEQAANHKALMENPANWNDPPGSVQNFLASPALQDQAFDRGTQKNYQVLVAQGVIKPDTPPDQIAGHLSGAHSQGAGTYADAVKTGKILTDGAGTPVASYYTGAAAAVNGKAPPPSANNSQKNGKPTEDKPATDPKVLNGTNRSLQETRIGNTVYIGGTAKKKPPIPLPFSNVLSAYSSYNAIITISCISSAMHSNPKQSYKSGNIGTVVLRSSGAGDLAGESAIKTKDNPTGKYDFGINNVEISSQITYNRETQASNAYNITFEVFEPYSMGLFMQVCQNAAQSQGWASYLNPATFLLTFEFIGYNADGTPIKVPDTTRNIPFTFTNISMTATGGGSVYRVTALPSNEMVFLNNFKLFEHDISVEGSTVQEALQSGERSLQTIVNKRLQEYASKNPAATAFDEVIIIFPKTQDVNELQGVNQEGNNIGIELRAEDGTISNIRRSSEDGTLYDASGLSSQAPGVSPEVAKINPNSATSFVPKVSRKVSAANLIQESDDLNAIGKSVLQFDSSMAAESKSNDQNDIQIDPSNPISRNKITYDKNTRQFTYSQGTSIVNAISSILLHSKYCRAGVDAQKVDSKGMIPWFRIESEVHFQQPKEGNIGDNNIPKLLVFKVVPYFVHSERNTANQAAPAGLAELATEVAKVYDYLYTGKNTEVLGFNIEFPQAMFNSVAKGSGLDDAALTANGRNAATPDSNTAKIANDNSSYWGERNAPRMASNGPTPESNTNGGTNYVDQKTRVAQAFQRALNDSETDLVNIPNFTIMGDPYFLADSGLGNFSNSGSGSFNVTKDLAMDYQSGEVDIAITFRTPVDYNSTTGLMDFGSTEIVRHFSGLYRVLEARHRFQSGKFTQELSLQRRRNQTAESTNKPVPVSGQVSAADSLSPGEVIVNGNNPGVAFSREAQNTAINRTPAIEGPATGAPPGDSAPNQRVAAFNRSDLANDSGDSGSATANPSAPGSIAKSFVEGLGIIKNKVVSTLFKPTNSKNETQNTSEFNKQ